MTNPMTYAEMLAQLEKAAEFAINDDSSACYIEPVIDSLRVRVEAEKPLIKGDVVIIGLEHIDIDALGAAYEVNVIKSLTIDRNWFCEYVKQKSKLNKDKDHA